MDHSTPSEGDQKDRQDPGVRILSADEVKKELNAMDPDTRQKTIEMGHKLKDIIQSAVSIVEGNPNLPLSTFKQRILDRVGPLPIQKVDLPIDALKLLYGKMYDRPPPEEHMGALDALSRIFSPGQGHGEVTSPAPCAPSEPEIDYANAPNLREQAVNAVTKPEFAGVTPSLGSTGSGESPRSEGSQGGIRKAHVSREQYERLLARMDNSAKQSTQEAATMLRNYMKASVDYFREDPSLSLPVYQQKMIERFGPLPSYPQWQYLTYTHLCTMYETIYNSSHHAPHASAALHALIELLPKGRSGDTTGDAARQANQYANDDYMYSTGSGLHGAGGFPPRQPNYDALPSELEVTCNNLGGTFIVPNQTISCHCNLCGQVASDNGLSRLELSFNEFERHAGMGQSKKWKYTIRLIDPVMTLGQWMDEQGILIKYTRGTKDDSLLRKAEKEREAAERQLQGKAGGVKFEDGIVPGSGGSAGIGGTAAPAVKPRTIPRKPSYVQRTDDGGGYFTEGGQTETETEFQRQRRGGGGAATASAGVGGRASQRQRKQPQWMKQTIDPNAVFGGKPLINREEGDTSEDDDDTKPRAGPRGGVLRPRSGDGGYGGGGKRARIDPDILLEAEIDTALARGLQPELHGWRITDSNQLAVTVHLGGVVFSGMLPARPPRAASSPAIAAVVREQQAAAAAAARGAAAEAEAGYPSDENLRMELPPVPTSARAVAAAAAAAAAASGYDDDGYGGNGGGGSSRMDERRAAAAAEYERLLVSGPPPNAKCAMCHNTEGDNDVPRTARGPGGRSQLGLGSLILVKSSAVTNCWVHDQCARWSPDVYDPTGEGILEGIAAAVRRGRMLKCKTCGLKGATLGCLKKTCKCSYHLPCARQANCLLHAEPYAVACPEHVEHLPDGLSYKLGFRKGKKGARVMRGDADEMMQYREESSPQEMSQQQPMYRPPNAGAPAPPPYHHNPYHHQHYQPPQPPPYHHPYGGGGGGGYY